MTKVLKNKGWPNLFFYENLGTTAVDLHPIVLAYRTGKKVYWLNPHPSVILSFENGRADVVKEGGKFIEKNYT